MQRRVGREAPLQLSLEAQDMGSQTQVEGEASLKEKQPKPGSRGLTVWGLGNDMHPTVGPRAVGPCLESRLGSTARSQGPA